MFRKIIAYGAILFLSLFSALSFAFYSEQSRTVAAQRAYHPLPSGLLAQSSSALPLLPSATNVGVTPQGYDDMKPIIDALGFNNVEIPSSDLTDFEKIKDKNVLFINCAAETDTYAAPAVASLKKFVQEGGAIYASDFANSYIQEAFSDKVKFHKVQNKNEYSVPRVGNAGEIKAKIVDPGLAQILGKNEININFNLGAWAVIESVSSDVTVHVTGDAQITDLGGNIEQLDQETLSDPEKLQQYYNQNSQTLSGVPFVVSFPYGKGEVIYTSFHNEAQVTDDMKKMLDWFVVRVRASSLASTARGLASEAAGKDTETIFEVVDTFQKGTGSKKYSLEIENAGKFSAVLLPESGVLKLKISGSSGDNLGEAETKSPATLSVKDAKKGTYTFEISEVSLEQDKTSFALSTVGTPQPKKYTPTQKNGGSSDTTPSTFFSNLVKKAVIWLIVIGVVVLAVIVLIIWLIIRAASGGKKSFDKTQDKNPKSGGPPSAPSASPPALSTPKK